MGTKEGKTERGRPIDRDHPNHLSARTVHLGLNCIRASLLLFTFPPPLSSSSPFPLVFLSPRCILSLEYSLMSVTGWGAIRLRVC